MGWNQVETIRPTPLLTDTGTKPFLYFAHSFYCDGVELAWFDARALGREFAPANLV